MGFRARQDFSSFPSDELLAQVDDSVLSEFICDVIKFIYRVSCKNFVCRGWGAGMQIRAKDTCGL